MQSVKKKSLKILYLYRGTDLEVVIKIDPHKKDIERFMGSYVLKVLNDERSKGIAVVRTSPWYAAGPADPEEVALEGWEAIGALFGKRPQNMLKRKQEMLEDGVIFYSKQGGPPPSKKVLAFPSVLKRWAIEKTTKGERV